MSGLCDTTFITEIANMLQVRMIKYSYRFIPLIILLGFLSACGANEGILKSGKDSVLSTNSTPVLSSLAKDVDEMRTADFKFIYVLRRKDGALMDAEDKSVIRMQTYQANRRVSSDGGKAVVVGSNTAIPPDKMLAVYDRFAVENFSQ